MMEISSFINNLFLIMAVGIVFVVLFWFLLFRYGIFDRFAEVF